MGKYKNIQVPPTSYEIIRDGQRYIGTVIDCRIGKWYQVLWDDGTITTETDSGRPI